MSKIWTDNSMKICSVYLCFLKDLQDKICKLMSTLSAFPWFIPNLKGCNGSAQVIWLDRAHAQSCSPVNLPYLPCHFVEY